MHRLRPDVDLLAGTARVSLIRRADKAQSGFKLLLHLRAVGNGQGYGPRGHIIDRPSVDLCHFGSFVVIEFPCAGIVTLKKDHHLNPVWRTTKDRLTVSIQVHGPKT